MTNLERLKMEIKGIDTNETELDIYLIENDLTATDDYDATSNTNKKAIYQTAVSILESIANNPSTMKNYKTADISVSMFQMNLQNRIDYLNRKIRLMPSDDDFSDGGATIGYLFTE